MSDAKIDKKAVEEFARDIERSKKALLGRLAERGYQLLRAEVPEVTGNLKQGVAPPMLNLTGRQVTKAENSFGHTDVDYEELTATLTVSARSARRGSRQATLFDKEGREKKKVTLRPTRAYNYAEVVAKGGPTISPKKSKALLIPVPTAPTGESYLMVDGQVLVVRKSAKGMKPNPYDARAAAQLEKEAASIAEATFREIFD
jgi:hypothetical protein